MPARHARSSKWQASDVAELLLARRREHLHEPEETYQPSSGSRPPWLPAATTKVAAERGPYLELFARQSRPGWDSFGNQPGLFDRGPVITRRRPSREAHARRRAHKRAPWDGGVP
jgi:N6-adenosine-specific RNA methylase IME4